MRKNISVVKIQCVKEKGLSYGQIQNKSDAGKIVRDFIGDSDRENFVVLLLDRKHKINGINLVSLGSVSACIVHPREVFKAAILANASSIIIGHNHPSGDTYPSTEDRKITKVLKAAGKLLDIPVLDHVIVGDEGDYVFSFATEGIL